MIKIDIISGFLGAGKTTLIKKLLEEKAFTNDRIVLIENEFGEIGIDGALLKGYGIGIKEMNSGCICCTIAGDFTKALKEMINRYQPDRIIIEPSGVGKLSDVIKGCRLLTGDLLIEINICLTVVDGLKYNLYRKNFAEFYTDQLIHAKSIILSRTQSMRPEELDAIIKDIKKHNKSAPIIITEWELLPGTDIVKLSEHSDAYSLEKGMMKVLQSSDKGSGRSGQIVNKRITGGISQKHHHADEVFSVWSKETAKLYDSRQLEEILRQLEQLSGIVLRAKGIVRTNKNRWLQFDYVPGEHRIRETSADYIGRICVIGEHINEMELQEIFRQ